jgi:tetratricopeptide (TPR) repeat protein
MKNIIRITAVFFVIILTIGCVTHKKKGEEKTSWLGKKYHKMTSHYNYWFNANELITTTTAKLNAQHKDNYNQLLDLYPYVAEDPQSSKGDLDNVIKKASTAISLHRVSEWSDDCYMLIGQAQYLKKDFETAEATFLYIKDEHDPKKITKKAKVKKSKKKKDSKKKSSKKKKKKKPSKKKSKSKSKKSSKDKKSDKKEEKATPTKEEAKKEDIPKPDELPKPSGDDPYKKNIFKRGAAFPMSMIWYGRTLVEREKHEEAEYLFNELWEDPFFPNKFKDDLATAEAYNWLKQKKYAQAIEPLQKAIQLTKKKKQRARLAYILAQLYDRSGRSEEAYATYETVLKSRPTYEMEFNARIHQIENAWENGKMTGKEADRVLNKMTKDSKNEEYQDQIYFTLATIALKNNMKPEAIAYLRKSLDFNKGNISQKAESYLKLADLYFEGEDFVFAKNYYDSTLTVLPTTDSRYKKVDNYAKNLTEIAQQMVIITANDSIVNIYNMNPSDRRDFAKKLKKRQDEEDAASAALAAEKDAKKNTAVAGNTNSKSAQLAGSKSSSFYFYNEAFLKKGKKDFTRVWGERKLEDNWRRSSRRPGQDSGEEVATLVDTAQANKKGEEDLDGFFKGIPQNEAELMALNGITYEAMYKLGTLFREKLQNNRRCSGTLETMQTRYPTFDKYEKETWYYCYLAFSDLNNQSKAQEYLDKLVEKHPTSPFTRAISDPEFLKNQKDKEREVTSFYETTYASFKSGDYKSAFASCQDAPRKFGSTNPLMSKFALLSALCTGNLQGQDAYCGALSEVIGRYPESSESTRAKEIARLLGCKGFEVSDAPNKKDGGEIDDKFTVEDDKLHYFLVILDNQDGNLKIDNVKAAVSDFNGDSYKADKLRISNIFLGTDTDFPIVVIRKFDNKDAAMKYFRAVEKNKEYLGEGKKEYKKEFFAVTQENYRRILKNKTLEGYREFFSEHYMK